MPRKRVIHPNEASTWLGILLSAVFDPTNMFNSLNFARSAQILNAKFKKQGLAEDQTPKIGKCQLLNLAYDFTNNPEEFPPKRQAALLLEWSYQWIQPEDWQRLQERNKKRREPIREDSDIPF